MYLGFAAADAPGPYAPGLVEPREDLGDAAVGDEELPRYVAGPHTHKGQLDDLLPDAVR
jgi:hypothetical protein